MAVRIEMEMLFFWSWYYCHLPSVLCHSLLCVGESLCPEKIDWWCAGVSQSVDQSAEWCKWFACVSLFSPYHCYPIIFCVIKIQNYVPFLSSFTKIVLAKKQLCELLCVNYLTVNYMLFKSCCKNGQPQWWVMSASRRYEAYRVHA